MTTVLDARGLACPAPVLLTKDALEKETPAELEILVDNDAARENVTRFLGSKNYRVSAAAEGGDYRLTARRQGGVGPGAEPVSRPAPRAAAEAGQKILVMIPTDRMGFGDDDLGRKLVVSFIKTLKEMGDDLWRLVLVNNGVKLTIEGSPVLADLQAYAKEGLTILVCGTCLSHFNLLEAKQVGQTTNMLDIVTAMQLADKVISI
jgi:selenium metabolism protein YedF